MPEGKVETGSAVHAAVVSSPVADPRYRDALPSSAAPLSNLGAPTTTSPYPSPFTSPADDTEYPNHAFSWSDSAVDAAVASSPDAAPKYRYALPSFADPLS